MLTREKPHAHTHTHTPQDLLMLQQAGYMLTHKTVIG